MEHMENTMEKTALQQIDELSRMPIVDLRKRWSDLFGIDGGRFTRSYLVRRLAYRIQELSLGGLSCDTRRRIKKLADGQAAGSKRDSPRHTQTQLDPGTRLLREWHGDQYEIVVTHDGFLYDGRPYRSLSAIAKAITGAHWNGKQFFGLTKRDHRKKTCLPPARRGVAGRHGRQNDIDKTTEKSMCDLHPRQQ